MSLRVRKVLKDCTNSNYVDKVGIDNDVSILNIHSLLLIKIIVSIEEEFDIEFDDEILVMNNCITLRKLM
ncbi:phosphopantetheine-binding protein [Anaerocolumna jejuensis]|uniref:phosphopantetheine-binding protein n=1 Tax=Anaerocolumna jejuensis TaxID=259063 RepID=UPI003F7B586C